MSFKFEKSPKAGEIFLFLSDIPQQFRVRARVDGKGVTVRSKDCPDPPCHEYISLRKDSAGRQLVLQAIAPNGEVVTEIKLLISESQGEKLTSFWRRP